MAGPFRAAAELLLQKQAPSQATTVALSTLGSLVGSHYGAKLGPRVGRRIAPELAQQGITSQVLSELAEENRHIPEELSDLSAKLDGKDAPAAAAEMLRKLRNEVGNRGVLSNQADHEAPKQQIGSVLGGLVGGAAPMLRHHLHEEKVDALAKRLMAGTALTAAGGGAYYAHKNKHASPEDLREWLLKLAAAPGATPLGRAMWNSTTQAVGRLIRPAALGEVAHVAAPMGFGNMAQRAQEVAGMRALGFDAAANANKAANSTLGRWSDKLMGLPPTPAPAGPAMMDPAKLTARPMFQGHAAPADARAAFRQYMGSPRTYARQAAPGTQGLGTMPAPKGAFNIPQTAGYTPGQVMEAGARATGTARLPLAEQVAGRRAASAAARPAPNLPAAPVQPAAPVRPAQSAAPTTAPATPPPAAAQAADEGFKIPVGAGDAPEIVAAKGKLQEVADTLSSISPAWAQNVKQYGGVAAMLAIPFIASMGERAAFKIGMHRAMEKALPWAAGGVAGGAALGLMSNRGDR